MNSKSIISDIINKSKGYSIALFTTFNFDVQFFERNILNALLNNNVKKVSLFVDSDNLYEALNKTDSSFIEQKYRVTPIEINKSFHPKLILLLSDKKAKLVVSSANLSFSAYTQNNEVFNEFDYDNNNPEYLNMINLAINYFITLSNKFKSLDKDLFNEIKNFNYHHRKFENNNALLIYNSEESIFSQIEKVIPNCNSIDIAVPFYDNDLLALKKLKEKYININLYVQNELSTFDFKKNSLEKIISEDNIFIFNDFKEIGTKRFYHGKVFRFNLNDCSYILYGSTNCTNAALFENGDKGNYECDVLIRGNKEEFNYYFDNFIKMDFKVNPTNRKLEYKSKIQSNFKFVINRFEDKLIFKYKTLSDDLKIYIKNNEYKYELENNEIVIIIDDNVPIGLLEVKFEYDNKIEIEKCFRVNSRVLYDFRNSGNNIINLNVNNLINNKSDSMIKYYKMLLELVPYDFNSLIDYKQTKSIYNDVKTQENVEENFDENFFVDFDIPDEILNKQKEYSGINELKKEIINNFINSIKKGIIHNKKRMITSKISTNKQIKTYIPKSEETRFVSYINRLFRNVLNKEYLTNISVKQYVDNVFLLLNVITTYNYEHNSEVFEINNYSLMILEFIESLLSFDLKELNQDIIETIKIFLFVPIIFGYIEKLNEKLDIKQELKYKRILLEYDKLFDLKSNYKLLVQKAYNSIIDCNIDEYGLLKYIDSLFDYKNIEELKSFIKNNLHGVIDIKKEEDIFNISIETHDVSRYFKPDNLKLCLNEIKKYSLQIEKIDKVFVKILNNSIDLSKPNPIKCILYIYIVKKNLIKRYFKKLHDVNFIFQDDIKL